MSNMSESRIEKIRCRVPLRISFAGGGTDLPYYFEKNGGAVIGSTIDKFAYSTLIPKSVDSDNIAIHSNDFDIHSILEIKRKFFDIKYNGELDLAKAVVNVLKPKNLGFEIITSSDVGPGSGLASSSAMIISLVGVLKSYMNLPLTAYDIAKISYEIEREELGINGGFQDQYAVTFGGFYFIEFKSKNVIVNPLKIRSDIIHELESSLLLVNTGITRDSSEVHSIQNENISEEKFELLDKLKEQAYDMKLQLLRGDLKSFAEELDNTWQTKRSLDNIISNPKIDKIYQTSKNAGAIGGKLLGAGAGGHFLFYVDINKRKTLEKSLQSIGCTTLPFSFETHGVQTWKIQNNGIHPS